jgi:SAM-dependent methyltransferase
MNPDRFFELLAREGMDSWRGPNWPKQGATLSVVAIHQYRAVFELLDQHVNSGSPMDVLDWGSGSGVFAYAIGSEGHRVRAIDPVNPPMGDFISSATDGRVQFDKFDDPVLLPYEDQSFDVVLSNACLEHVGDTGGSDVKSLREVHRILRPEGVFICSHLPNRYSYIEQATRFISWAMKKFTGRYFHHHEFLYTRESVDSLAQDTGFAVSGWKVYGAIPRNPLSSIPPSVRDAPAFIRGVDRLDDFLANTPFRMICQNFAFVARRLPEPTKSQVRN